MSQWGNNDVASNSVFWGVVNAKLKANSTNRTAFFDNNTPDQFIEGVTIGQWGVDPTEIGISAGPVSLITITSGGSGYTSNPTITFTGGGGSSAAGTGTANSSTGKIYTYSLSNAGSGYTSNPSITFAAPAATSFNANSDVTGGTGGGANSVIALSSAGKFQANDAIIYTVASGNTALSGLTSGTTYYVQFANATVVALKETLTGGRITLTKGLTQSGHTLKGATATGAAVIGGAKNKGVTHAGWVVRKVGSGGRAGRVQYETLVAMGSMTGDAEDTVLPDA
jgi:hypothetical protein